jgi:hypothetical protein
LSYQQDHPTRNPNSHQIQLPGTKDAENENEEVDNREVKIGGDPPVPPPMSSQPIPHLPLESTSCNLTFVHSLTLPCSQLMNLGAKYEASRFDA